MNKAGWILALVLAAFCVFLYLRKPGPSSSVIPGVTVRTDSVIVHDTIKTEIMVPVIKKIIIHDTLQPTINVDSTVSYSIDQHYPRNAYVRAEMLSKEFPAERPKDFKGLITYVPPIDSIRIETRTDTTPKIIFKPPVIPTWQAVTLGLAAGVLATLVVKKGEK